MPLDDLAPHPAPGVTNEALRARAVHLNAQMRHHSAADVVTLAAKQVSNLALVSSFGAESVVLLHLASMVQRDLPVLFIDTELLFTETLVYQQELTERLGLKNVTILRSGNIAQIDAAGTLHHHDTDACCALRKTLPLQTALSGFDGWITGRKRFQSGTRAALEHFEFEERIGGAPRLKVNPLAHWAAADVADYMTENRLPRHPLVARGYLSIGCAPCTSPVEKGEEPRAGRWRKTKKSECGIHHINGKIVRTGDKT